MRDNEAVLFKKPSQAREISPGAALALANEWDKAAHDQASNPAKRRTLQRCARELRMLIYPYRIGGMPVRGVDARINSAVTGFDLPDGVFVKLDDKCVGHLVSALAIGGNEGTPCRLCGLWVIE